MRRSLSTSHALALGVVGVCTLAAACGDGSPASPGGVGPGGAGGTAGSDGTGAASTTATSPGCPPTDACHLAGVWDAEKGACTNPIAADGTACDDVDACSTDDSCATGLCVGKPLVCTASDSCHLAGSCDPSTGLCSDPPDPKALGTLGARCGTLPVLLDMGYGTLGLLPHIKLPGDWNPYLLDGNVDSANRLKLYERAHAVGLRPYWLAYGNVFEGLLGVERARGKKPDPNAPKGRGLVDECGNATDAGGSVAACRQSYGACGGKVGGSTKAELEKTFDDWFADGALGLHTDTNTARSEKPTGLFPDALPKHTVDALQVDLEGECFKELLKPNGDATEQAKGLDIFAHVFDALEAGLAKNGIGAGTGPATELGLYGVPSGRERCSPYDDNLGMPPTFPSGLIGYWTDECRYLVPQLAPEKCGPNPPVRCAADRMTTTSLGDGYALLGRLVPWMYLTGKLPWDHPAFTWLPKIDDGNPATYEGDDVMALADLPNRQQAFFTRYFEGSGVSTSLASLNRRIDELPGGVLFPSIYKSAGAIELAWGDVSHNEWQHNLVGLGAAAFEHKTHGHADPHVAKVFAHMLLVHRETAQLANRVLLEIAWGWKHFTGRKLAPIVTIVPGGGVTQTMMRDPADASGATVCTADNAILRTDAGLPGRCGDVPPACSLAGYRKQTALPAHPGRKAVYHAWDATTKAYVPEPSHPEARTYVMQNVEIYAHQTLDEFEATQVRPMVMAVPHGEVDAVVNWPDATALAGLCAGQGRRLKYGGGFQYMNSYGGYENTGVPEPLWLRFFAPGPLDAWCHDGHEAACREVFDWTQPCASGDTCEPHWPSVADDLAVEELCTEAVANYTLARWERVRQVFEDANANKSSDLAYQPTAFCGYLEAWFTQKFGAPPTPMCK